MAILACEEEIFERYFSISREGELQGYPEGFFESLSHVDQLVRLVVHFDGEVQNGGMEQWLTNPSGHYAKETLMALERIGANESAALVREALAFFPEGQPSRDQSERRRQFASLSSEEKERIFVLGDAYTREKSGKIFELLHTFIEGHQVM